MPPGITRFLEIHCPDPAALTSAFSKLPARQKRLTDGQRLCGEGDAADEMWIVLSGEVVVESKGIRVTERGYGELVGEMSFYQPPGKQVRSASMRAAGDTNLARIDKAHIKQWDHVSQSLWHETVARVLTQKLAEATYRRVELHQSREDMTGLVSRLVCAEGKEAAVAVLTGGQIAHDQCDVVVWLSDIKGFSTFAEDKSPAEAGRIMREIMTIQGKCIEAHGGSIDKFMGDGLMAYWRAPDADRLMKNANGALTAAIDAAQELEHLFSERSLPLGIRIGLHCGAAVLGDFGGGGRIAFTSLGKTINRASRYEQQREDIEGTDLGTIRISDALYRSLGDGPLVSRFCSSAKRFLDKNKLEYLVHTLKGQ